ncbi:uncharacterized protein LOC131065841 isoform X2 [Cryptomeria japonica]|uniref:uncharacterized protein LOC131065841 isoform X2 n=1 Tax=Cryptomeria japonica TaxID=3369 RepID=UPI0027DA38B7|nr:uncharacterized protein LOC131065841 isoform X2 [Cryptomeria japonica]
MFQVCEICGDAGFAEMLFICNQCRGAEHLYCMSKQPDSDGEACWSCETCKLKQETIQGTVISSLYSEIEQSQEKLSKCQRECQDSHPAIKKQALEGSNGTDSPNKKQELDDFDGTKSVTASKKKAIESSNKTDSLPKHREKTHRSYTASKMQELESSDGTDALRLSNKHEFESSNVTDFPQRRKTQVLKNSNGTGFSVMRKRQVVESSDGTYSLPFGKKQELEISKGTNSLAFSKNQELQNSKCSNHTDSLLISKKEVVKSSFSTDSPTASDKQTPESSNCTDFLPVRKKRVFENFKGTDSLPASKKQALRSSNGADSLPARKKQATESSNGTDLSKESSENKSSSRQLPGSKEQMVTAPVSSGSKSAMVDKSWDSSCPNALDSEKKPLSSKEIGSGCEQSSLHSKLSKSKITVECKMELEKLVPADSIKELESNKDGSKLANKVLEKHKLSKMPESLSSMEVDMVCSRGALTKGDSSGYGAVSAGVTNDRKEIDQSLIGKSTVDDTITVNERNYEINNRSIERNSISQDRDKRKLNVNVVSCNNHSLRSLTEYDREKIGHSMINFSEINVSSSSELENRSFNTCERGYNKGNMLSYTNYSSGTSLPQQLQLAMPQSLILWKGTFKVVDIACGHAIYGGMQAHPSTTASEKVYEMSEQFGSQLYLEQVHRAEAWPKRFEHSPPTDDNVGLYFFPEDGRSEWSFATLVEYINNHDLAMRMHLDGAELLIFSSIQLPKYVQRIFGKFYLWGVFRRAEKSTIGHKLRETSMQHDHVRADMANSVAPSRSNNSDSDTSVVEIPNVHKNGVKGKMDFEMEGEKDDAISERQLRRMDSQPAGSPPVHISPLSLPLDSEVKHIRASGIKANDTNASGCALYGQDQSLQGIRSKVNSENCTEEASRRYSGKQIDQSRERYHWSGIEKVDGQSVFNSSDPHTSHRHYSGKSRKSMHERSNEHHSHEELNIGESTTRFGASNRIPSLEEKDEIELHTLQPQATNIKPGFAPASCRTDCNSQPSSSDHLHEKRGFMHFQVESNANAGAKNQKDLRDQCHVLSTGSRLDGLHKSHQSSLSSGDSDSSYGNKGRSLSQPPAQRKIYKYEDVNRFSRSQSFKDHIGVQTKRYNEEKDRRNKDTKLGMKSYRERSHRHWQTEDGRRHVHMENCRSSVINYRVNSSDSYSNKGYMVEETSMHRDASSYSHEKTTLHRWSSNNQQIQIKTCVDKDMAGNLKSVKHGLSSIKRTQGETILLDVEKDCSVIQLGEASDQYQVVKDQQSFTPLHSATDEAAENNTVSEILNAATPPESPGQIYPGETVPRILEADLPVTVNSSTEHTTTLALDQNPLLSHASWYADSSTDQADQEPGKCLKLFPLEEENLGATKNIVKEWDINLDLSLGRSSLKNVLKVADRQVCPNKSNLEGPDVHSCLGVSLPLEKRKETYYLN